MKATQQNDYRTEVSQSGEHLIIEESTGAHTGLLIPHTYLDIPVFQERARQTLNFHADDLQRRIENLKRLLARVNRAQDVIIEDFKALDRLNSTN